MLAEDQDNSWRSIYKIGAVALPLSPLIYIFSQSIQLVLNTYPPINVAGGPGSGLVNGLDFIGVNSFLFNSEYALITLSVLVALPAVIALLVALRKTDIGIASIGTGLLLLGIVFVLYETTTAFSEIQEAVTWNSGCTVCGNTPIEAAAGTFSGSTGGELGSLLIVVGILILSVLMLRGTTFSKVSGYLGVIAALEGIVGTFAFSNMSGNDAVFTGVIPYVLLTVWGVTLSPRLFKLGQT